MTWAMYDALVMPATAWTPTRRPRPRASRRGRQSVRRGNRHLAVPALPQPRRWRRVREADRPACWTVSNASPNRPSRRSRAWLPAAAARSRWSAISASPRRTRPSASRSRARSATACRAPATPHGRSARPGRVKDMLFTGRFVPADEAAADGPGEPARAGGRHRARRARSLALRDRGQRAAHHSRHQRDRLGDCWPQRRLKAGDDRDLVELCYTSADFREGVTRVPAKRAAEVDGRLAPRHSNASSGCIVNASTAPSSSRPSDPRTAGASRRSGPRRSRTTSGDRIAASAEPVFISPLAVPENLRRDVHRDRPHRADHELREEERRPPGSARSSSDRGVQNIGSRQTNDAEKAARR